MLRRYKPIHPRLSSGAMALTAIFSLVGYSTSFAADDILTYAGPDRVQRLLEGARKEGAVVLYSTIIVNQALRPLADGFQKKYPFVKMTFWRGDSEEMLTKASIEQRAGKITGDVLEGPGVGELAVHANLAEQYSTPAINDYPKAYHDPRGLWTVDRMSYYSLAYNTKMVPKEIVPKSYEDLLDPRWKDKMAWRIGTSGGMPLFLTTLRVAWGEEKAMSYFQKLRSQNVLNFAAGSARTLVDRVVAGEYPLAISIFAHHPLISAEKGAPVNSQLLDPVTATSSTLILVKGTRHPHASLLLIDFILSKEGQEILAKAEYYPAHPDVHALPTLHSVVPRRAGVPEAFITPEASLKYLPSSLKIWEDLFR